MNIDKIYILTEADNVALNIARDLNKYYGDKTILLCNKNNKKTIRFLYNTKFKDKIKIVNTYNEYFNQLEKDDNKINLIFPTHDFDIFEILNSDSIISKCFIPNIEQLKVILDKEKLYNILKDIDIPLLKIYDNLSELQYPLVIKEKRRENIDFWKSFNSKHLLIKNSEELKIVSEKFAKIDNLIFQEYLPKTPNNEFSFIGYRYKNGKVIGKTVRKTHQIKQGGVTTFAEYVESNKIEKYAKIILEKFKYEGIFEIEFLYSAERDDYFFIDFNARCCAWYNLLSGSGINLPMIYVSDIIGTNDHPAKFTKKKFIDLKSEIMNYIVYDNNIIVVFNRLFWLIKEIVKSDIVFVIYSKDDKRCNRYLFYDIFNAVCRYYYSKIKKKIKSIIKIINLNYLTFLKDIK